MQLAGRAQAACEVLTEIVERHRPAAAALQDWARAHRFAGSGDRAAIGNLVYDVLRRRQLLAHLAGNDAMPSLVAAALKQSWGMTPDAVAALFDGSAHAPQPLPADVLVNLAREAEAAPPWVRGDYPEWLHGAMERNFGEAAADEGAALAERAPLDLRVNTFKATRAKLLQALARHQAEATAFSPLGVRIPAREGAARSPNVEAENSHGRGWFEVQDEGSQIAALLAGAGARQQVLDLCAGAGGKTLALAAAMQNTGQIYAYDSDAHRLRPIFERLKRAGARNVQVLTAGDEAALARLDAGMDLVLIDAPCSGSGVWRRRPDAKWRLSSDQLNARREEQRALLASGARFVKPGGRLVYVTCSMFAEENQDQAAWFTGAYPDFQPVDYKDLWPGRLTGEPPASAANTGPALQLTPRLHGTDGFFAAVFHRI